MDRSNNTTEYSLQTESARYEKILKDFGIHFDDLPGDVNALLDECIKTQSMLKLAELDVPSLQSVYNKFKKEDFDNRMLAIQLRKDVSVLKQQVKAEAEECAALEKFLKEAKETQATPAEMNAQKFELETIMQSMQNRKNSIKVPGNVDLEALLEKIKLLDRNKDEC